MALPTEKQFIDLGIPDLVIALRLGMTEPKQLTFRGKKKIQQLTQGVRRTALPPVFCQIRRDVIIAISETATRRGRVTH